MDYMISAEPKAKTKNLQVYSYAYIPFTNKKVDIYYAKVVYKSFFTNYLILIVIQVRTVTHTQVSLMWIQTQVKGYM